MNSRVVVYGGKGALGSTVVTHFKSENWWVISIDFNQNPEADYNILVGKDESLEQQHNKVTTQVTAVLSGNKLDAIICVAEGWASGNAIRDLIKSFEFTWSRNVWSSLIAAEIAATHLREGGLLTLTGNKAALDGTPAMIGYGMSKCAVHHLCRSLACENSGMPRNSTTVAILPVTLDTPRNRQRKARSDYSSWTPLGFLAETFLDWSNGKSRPSNGSLLQLITTNYHTKIVPV